MAISIGSVQAPLVLEEINRQDKKDKLTEIVGKEERVEGGVFQVSCFDLPCVEEESHLEDHEGVEEHQHRVVADKLVLNSDELLDCT
jgi:hypothetical protein